jgi:exosortase
MRASARFRNGWTIWHAMAALAMVGACGLAAGDAWADLSRIGWRDEESSHVLLVPLVVAWLVWVRRGRFRGCSPGGRLPGTLLMAAGCLLWSYGYRHQVQSLWHLGAVVLAVGGLLTVTGKELLLRFLPAFVVLGFLVPVPNTARQWIALPLQHATARATQDAAEVLGMWVVRQGNLLTLNGHEVAIAEACNGMRMVFTLFLACYLFAFVTPLRGYVRALILVASPLLAVLANVVRLVPTVWVFGHAPPAVAEAFHTASGWVMLVVAFIGLMSIVRLLRWAMIPVAPFTLAAA